MTTKTEAPDVGTVYAAASERARQAKAEAGRTPGALDYFVGNANGRGLIRIEACSESPEAGDHIASLTRTAKNEANAKHIVLCWNTHEELVEALEGAAKALAMLTEPDAIKSTSVQHAWAQCIAAERSARAALKAATGGVK